MREPSLANESKTESSQLLVGKTLAITHTDNADLGNGCSCLCLSWVCRKDAAGAKGLSVGREGGPLTRVRGNVNPAGRHGGTDVIC